MLKKYMFYLVFCLLPQMASASQEYDTCFQQAKDDNQVALCMKAETTRLLTEIQKIYQNILKNPQTASWNQGTSLAKGNLKTMYDYWLAYRNRYCSLFVLASEHNFGSSEYDKERCLLNLTLDHYELVHQVIINANSGGEEDDEAHQQ